MVLGYSKGIEKDLLELMALTPEQAKAQAYNDTIAASEEQVALKLKPKFQNLAVFYPDLKIPDVKDEATFRRITKELIDTRQFTAESKNGETMVISLDDLNQKDNALGGLVKKEAKVKNLQELVPTRDQLKSTANAVAEGVEENLGSSFGGASWSNFLSGAMSWLGKALTWLIQGLTNGFKFGEFPGFMDTVAGTTADNMKESVGNNLKKLRETRPDMANMLTDDAIVGVTSEVHDQALVAAGVAVAKKSSKPSLADIPYDPLPTIAPPKAEAVTDVVLSGNPEEQVGTALNAIAGNILSGTKDPKSLAIAQNFKPEMVEIGKAVVLAHKDLLDKPGNLAELYVNELQKNKKINDGLKAMDIDLSSDIIKGGMIATVAEHLKVNGALLSKAVQGKASTAELDAPVADAVVDQLAGVDIKGLINKKVNDSLEAGIADEVRVKYNKGINSLFMPGAAGSSQVLNKHTDLSPMADAPAEVIRAREDLCAYADANGAGPSWQQREKISEIVTDETMAVLGEPKNKQLKTEELADVLSGRIERRLKEPESVKAINERGTSIAELNGDDGDLLKKIAGKIGDQLKDPKNKELANMVGGIQDSLLARKEISQKAALAAVDKARSQITGGQTHSEPSGAQLANKTQQRSATTELPG
jgi:hypothetical protein